MSVIPPSDEGQRGKFTGMSVNNRSTRGDYSALLEGSNIYNIYYRNIIYYARVYTLNLFRLGFGFLLSFVFHFSSFILESSKKNPLVKSRK